MKNVKLREKKILNPKKKFIKICEYTALFTRNLKTPTYTEGRNETQLYLLYIFLLQTETVLVGGGEGLPARARVQDGLQQVLVQR